MNMGVIPVTDLASRIAGLLNMEDLISTLEALRISAEFPEPGTGPADLIAGSLFDIGFRLERFERNQDAIAVYQRVVRYPVVDSQIRAGAWFRIALLSDHFGNWLAASSGYRQALDLAPAWTHMATLAQYNLAALVAAEENHAEACALYQAVETAPVHPDIPLAKVLLELGRCLLRSGEFASARNKLEQFLTTFPDAPATVEANRLLAEIHEYSGESEAAVERYRRIVASCQADPLLKAAAAHRAAVLGRHLKSGARA
jgi:tetratricopeptide (TPR) repeat protein